MNILFYMPNVMIGGVRTVTEILSDGFRRRGHNVTWLLQYRIYGDERDYPDNQECVYLPSKELVSLDNISFYKDYVGNNKINVIINQHGLYEGVMLIDTLQDSNVLRISVLHSNPISNYRWLFKDNVSLRNNSNIEKLKRIARIIIYPKTKINTNRAIFNQLRLLKNGGSHIVVLSPAYINIIQRIAPDITDISAIANPNTYKIVNHVPKEKIALFVGRLDNRSKKLQYLLNIWKKVQRIDSTWKLVIVGEGQDGDALKLQAASIPNIVFTGYKNPQSYYERASILCMTSLFEGFPLTLTEAMQHGCVPVVYDTFPAVRDIITNGVDGIIVHPFRHKEFAHQLLKLFEDEGYRSRLSSAAIENVCRFQTDKIVGQWLDLIYHLSHK